MDKYVFGYVSEDWQFFWPKEVETMKGHSASWPIVKGLMKIYRLVDDDYQQMKDENGKHGIS